MLEGKGCPGSLLFKDPRPDYVDCPNCGEEVEIWSDEPLARCLNCGFWVKYERLQRSRPPAADANGADAA